MIVAMQKLRERVPDRPATPSEKKSPPAPITPPQTYAVAWRDQKGNPPAEPESAPSSPVQAPPNPGPSQSTFANPSRSSEAPPVFPYVPVCGSVPDLRLGFSIKNPFVHPR